MFGYVDGYDFFNMEAEKYWAPTKNMNIKDLVSNAVGSGDYFAARKIDGHWFMMIKDDDGNIILRSRTKGVSGEYNNKINLVPHLEKEFEMLPNGTVFIGEIFFPKNEGSRKVTTIMGCKPDKAIARQEKGEKLHYYIFDMLSVDGILFLNRPMKERIAGAHATIDMYLPKNKYIHVAKYYEGQELLNYIGYVLEKGWEGVVLQRKDGIYEPGKRPARKSIKVKKEIENEIDCFLTGNYKPATWEYTGKEVQTWPYWYNNKKGELLYGTYYYDFLEGAPITPITKNAYYGWAGAVEIGVLKDGEVVPIGWISNVTEDIKEQIVQTPCPILHKVCKVSAMMMEKDTHALRHGRILEWREDISWKDCTWDKLGID